MKELIQRIDGEYLWWFVYGWKVLLSANFTLIKNRYICIILKKITFVLRWIVLFLVKTESNIVFYNAVLVSIQKHIKSGEGKDQQSWKQKTLGTQLQIKKIKYLSHFFFLPWKNYNGWKKYCVLCPQFELPIASLFNKIKIKKGLRPTPVQYTKRHKLVSLFCFTIFIRLLHSLVLHKKYLITNN